MFETTNQQVSVQCWWCFDIAHTAVAQIWMIPFHRITKCSFPCTDNQDAMSPSLIKFGSDMQDQNPAIQPYRWFKTLPHAAVQLRDWPPFQKQKPCLCIATFRPNISSTQVHFQFLQPKFSHAIIYLYNYTEYLLYVAANSASLTCVGSVPTFGFLNIHQETNEEAQNPNDTWQSTGVIWQPWGVPPQNMVPCETLGKNVTSWQLPEQRASKWENQSSKRFLRKWFI